MILEAGNSDYGLQQFGFRQYTTVKQEIFAAVKFCGFSILDFSREDIFADF